MTIQVEVVQTAYNSSQQELEGLQAAALETCQGIEEGEAQAGSSLASLPRALGGHVSQRMRRTLHLSVGKALGVVGSHYQVDFKAVSSDYIVPVGVEDEEAMNRADALAAPAVDALAEDFMEFLFQMLPAPTTLKPEDHRASSPFCLSVSVWVLWPCNVQSLN
jgi:hypothetical protein